MSSILKKNVILEGPFSVETPDSSGEVLAISSSDINDLYTGAAPVNTEHIGPSDSDDEEKHKDIKGFQGFQSIVGRVKSAKKIFSQADCKTPREMNAWNKYKKPMIYGQVELYDGPDAHDNARAASSLARMFNQIQDGPQLGLSVEGSTLEREGNILKRTVIKGLALTMRPCNHTAKVDLVADSNSPIVNKSIKRTYQDGTEPLRKSISMDNWNLEQANPTLDLSIALKSLKKTLDAGSLNAAPGSLTGGAALQKPLSSQLHKVIKMVGKKRPKKEEIMKAIPKLTEKEAEKVEKALEKSFLDENEQIMSDFYKKIKQSN